MTDWINNAARKIALELKERDEAVIRVTAGSTAATEKVVSLLFQAVLEMMPSGAQLKVDVIEDIGEVEVTFTVEGIHRLTSRSTPETAVSHLSAKLARVERLMMNLLEEHNRLSSEMEKLLMDEAADPLGL